MRMCISKSLRHIAQQMETNSVLLRTLLLAIFTAVPLFVKAQTMEPQWMHKLPEANPENGTYTFVRITADAYSLDLGRSKCFQLLTLDQSLLNTLTISYSSKDYITSTVHTQNGSFSENIDQKTFEVITTEGNPIQVKARVVDEFFSSKKQSMTTLYQVALTPNAMFDNYTLTTSYASDPATWGLSIIPGAAQMHKGDYLKGGIIMGGTVALAGGLIAFESMRSSYLAKIEQTHSADVKKSYNNKAGNCATIRNVCIGGLAALYVYNILDAFIAPGARRVIVAPAATADGQYGMTLSYKF